MKSFGLLALILVSWHIGYAQTAADTLPAPARCFPSGTSLTAVQVSDNGRYALIKNVREVWKVFDLTSGKVVNKAMQSSYADKIEPYLHEFNPDYTAWKFDLRTSRETAGGKNITRLKIYSREGQLLSEHTISNIATHSFNALTGDLIISEEKNWYVLSLNKPRRELKNKGKAWSAGFTFQFSPGGRFMATRSGHLVDLEKGIVTANAFPENSTGSMMADGKTYVINNGSELKVLNMEEAALTETIPLPENLPRIDGFTIIPLPTSPHQFIYWLNFNNKAAGGGLAYYVKDGVGFSLCDPQWEAEQTANLQQLAKEWQDAEAELARKQREAAIAYENRRKEYEQYKISHPETNAPVSAGPAYRSVTQKYSCEYCNGRGAVTVENYVPGAGRSSQTVYTVDSYGNRRYETTNYGYSTKKCTACNGKGEVTITEKILSE